MSDVRQLPGEIVTEIAMSKLYNTWLILEGISDERLFLARYFSKDVRAVVARGWENVISIVTGCEKMENKRVFGLIDRDYRDLKALQPTNANITITDYRDIENMLFESSALLKVYSEYGSISKLPKTESGRINIEAVKEELSEVAYKLGMFRAYCYANDINVCFDNIDHAKFIDDRDLSLNVKRFKNHIAGKPENKDLIFAIDWEETQSNWIPESIKSPVYVRHGHDLMSIIAISFRKRFASKGGAFSQEDIESFFRIAANDEEIRQFAFWKDLERKIAN